jgi:hypothetical protein
VRRLTALVSSAHSPTLLEHFNMAARIGTSLPALEFDQCNVQSKACDVIAHWFSHYNVDYDVLLVMNACFVTFFWMSFNMRYWDLADLMPKLD